MGFWNDINLPNLAENVLPTKHQARLDPAEGREPHGGAGAAAQALTRAPPRSSDAHQLRADPPPRIERMCGIVGYVGPRDSQAILLAGLARLEYRGYDSAGVAVIDGDGGLGMRKRAGKLKVLRDDLVDHPLADGTTGIGHTRWATHGGPTDTNAHPHLADDDKLAVIHNGIIENFSEIKAELLAEGYTFRSETDTEAAAILLGREYQARRRRPRGRVPRGRQPPRGCVHAAGDARGPPGPRRRRAPQLAARDRPRRGRELPRIRRRRLRRAHPQRARDRSGPDRRDHAVRGDRHRLPRQRRRGRALRDPLGRLGRRQGRLVELHGQGDQRGARSRREHDPRPRPRRTGRDPRARRSRRALRRHPAHHHRRVRHGRVRRRGGQVRDRAVGPGSGRRRARARVPLPRPRDRPRHAWSSRSASRARRWTP